MLFIKHCLPIQYISHDGIPLKLHCVQVVFIHCSMHSTAVLINYFNLRKHVYLHMYMLNCVMNEGMAFSGSVNIGTQVLMRTNYKRMLQASPMFWSKCLLPGYRYNLHLFDKCVLKKLNVNPLCTCYFIK